MLDREFEREIVKQLGDGRRPEELVAFVCQRTGLKWDAAKAEILRAQGRQQDIISRRRRWVILLLWGPIFLWSAFGVIGNLVAFLIDPAEYLKRSIRHPEGHLLLGTAILIFGGGSVGIFRRTKSS